METLFFTFAPHTTFVAEAKLASREAKTFLNIILRNIPQQMFPCLRSKEAKQFFLLPAHLHTQKIFQETIFPHLRGPEDQHNKT